MQEISLEREFETYKGIHKFSVVKASLIKFYNDLQNTGVSVPEFMCKSVEDLANEHLARIMEDGTFQRVYENCWDRYKDCLV